VYAEEGVAGFYKGCLTNLVRTTPAAALTFTSFELIARRLKAMGQRQRDREAGLVCPTLPLSLKLHSMAAPPHFARLPLASRRRPVRPFAPPARRSRRASRGGCAQDVEERRGAPARGFAQGAGQLSGGNVPPPTGRGDKPLDGGAELGTR